MINRGSTLNGVYYVYILKCVDKNSKISYYTGSTQDLVKRFDQHRSGQGARYTSGRDLDLVFFESFSNRSLAMKREYEIKNLSGPKKMQLIENFQNTIVKK